MNLAGITKFEYERENEENSGRSNKTDAIVQMAYRKCAYGKFVRSGGGEVRANKCVKNYSEIVSSRGSRKWDNMQMILGIKNYYQKKKRK